MDFNESPLLVVWEVTQACDLQCAHCRTEKQTETDRKELTTAEGFQLIDEIRKFGNPLLVITGGDPLKRPDLHQLIRHGVEEGLRTNLTPSPTPLLTKEAIDGFKACGISRMALSVDGADAAMQDAFRRQRGTFEVAVRALEYAQEIGLDSQMQTTVTHRNLNHLGEIAELAARVGTKMWSLFFLVNTGDAAPDDNLTADEYEKVFEFLFDITRIAPFEVKTTEAMHFRRYIARRMKAEHTREKKSVFRTPGVGDGRGFVFISHTGEIFPSGFLPISAGNVRRDSLVDIYRNSSLFRILRDSSLRQGKCAECDYAKICGGSRARAYAMTGNFLEQDPKCSYQAEPRRVHAGGGE